MLEMILVSFYGMHVLALVLLLRYMIYSSIMYLNLFSNIVISYN